MSSSWTSWGPGRMPAGGPGVGRGPAAVPPADPAAPNGTPSAAQGGGIVDVGWVAPAGTNGNSAPAFGGGFGGGHQFGAITITKIDGNKLSLQTADGWTRTIDATGATITRAGATITVGKVDMWIVAEGLRNTDGSFAASAVQAAAAKKHGDHPGGSDEASPAPASPQVPLVERLTPRGVVGRRRLGAPRRRPTAASAGVRRRRRPISCSAWSAPDRETSPAGRSGPAT